jgi:hypothetical protein
MILSTSTPGTAGPTVPLTPDARAAYEALYATNQTAIENTADVDLLKSLNATQLDIGNLLSADDQYRLNQNTAQFEALLKAINSTNAGLKILQTKIAGIAGGIAKFGEVVGAITKVLSVIPGV